MELVLHYKNVIMLFLYHYELGSKIETLQHYHGYYDALQDQAESK